MKILITLIVLISMNEIQSVSAQEIKTVNFAQLKPLLHQTNDTTYVINFWAVWCKPCVKELPEFEKIRKAYAAKNLKVVLVSLDFGAHAADRVRKFLDRKEIHAHAIILDDPDANAWIEKVDENWDGAIPVTLIYNKEKRIFLSHAITSAELSKTIDRIIN
ncbi:TlpA family protein disulfide reductase [Ancylomarina longa]|uniref:Alkyl hydroperoxide reductase n=1 Tax=Ancylomarina longa TaxID=2487017 RepID=A0A434AZM7_9BACT|nr:TlpA family protein disulfide reductase [Ancylomarina longa]RUT80082.1 alkyl hydroperoxide reductase [Ancylomarina longa]